MTESPVVFVLRLESSAREESGFTFPNTLSRAATATRLFFVYVCANV